MRAAAFLPFLALLVTMVNALKEPPKTLQIGVKKRIPEEECKVRSRDGDLLSMHYTGTLFDTGAKFDSSLDRNQPLEFTLGKGQVIKGWDQGLKNMCVGEKRRLVIPPEFGYGARGAGSAIPGGATLVFEVELVGVKPGDHVYPGAGAAGVDSKLGLLDSIDFQSPTVLAGAAVIVLAIAFIAKSLFGGGKAVEANTTASAASPSSSSSSSAEKKGKKNGGSSANKKK